MAGVGTHGAGERAAGMAEEQRLDEALRLRAAVDLPERSAAAAFGMNGPCEQLLAGAGLALDEDGDVVRSDFP